MNLLIDINVIVFAIVVSLFALETGVAILNLLAYKTYGKKAQDMIKSSWALNGTFIVFYLVNFEATYPLLLTAAGTLYIAPALIAGLCIIFRNAFIAYSEYSDEAPSRKNFTNIYAAATIIAVVLLVSVLNSAVSGNGINLSSLSVNYAQMFLSPYNIIMLICVVAISLLGAISFLNIAKPFGMTKTKAICALVLVAVLSSLIANYFYAPFVITGLVDKWYYLMPAVVMLIVMALLYLKESAKWLPGASFVWLLFSVAGFESLGHPTIFGGAINIDSSLTSPGAMYASLLITSITFLVIIVGVALLLYANSRPKKY